jgi:hypothetical protein
MLCMCCDVSEDPYVCGYGQYRCSSEQCISIEKVCDGESDCFNDADERHCGMLSMLSNNFFCSCLLEVLTGLTTSLCETSTGYVTMALRLCCLNFS